MAQSATLPESNTALTYTKPSSTPHLTHTPVPTPGSDELLIRVHAAAINPVDIQLWGNPVVGFLAGSKEKGIGRDYSGEVVKVGEDLKRDGWKEGDEVFGLCNRPTAEGTITSYLVISPYNCPIAKKPSSLPHTHAASIPLVTLTAFACLAWLPPASKSPNTPSPRRVIVSGASGGVGTWCVQLAKKVYNAHVTAICSSRNADFAKELGADEVIDYATQDVAQSLLSKRPGGKKYDLYIDCVGGTEMFKYWTQLLHPHAAYITIVGDKTARDAMGGPLTYFTYPAQVLRFIRGWMVGPRYANVLLLQDSRCLEQVAELVEKGEVKVEVQEVVHGALKEEGYVEAWEKVKGEMVKGRVRGKLVLDCLE